MSAFHITLIRPPYIVPVQSVFGNRGVLPLGLAYLNATLLDAGFDVNCIDAFAEDMDSFYPIGDQGFLINGLRNSDTVKLIPRGTKLIGISCMFSSEWINTEDLVKQIKKEFPEAFIVLGGEHATADSKHILEKNPEVDACILGEGEFKLKNLAIELSKGNFDKSKISGITYYDQASREVKSNEFPFRIKDINDIPRPQWNSFPIHKFLDMGLGHATVGKRAIPMIISRGCPYQCTFCSSKDMWITRWIPRSIDSIMAEIKSYIRDYQINHIDFYDLTAVVNKKWTLEFCQRIIDEDLKLTWSLPSGTRSEALDYEVLSMLKKSGCTKITYAPETGSERMSILIKKKVNLKKMLRSMKWAVELGYIVKSNIIVGFPDERYSDLLKSYIYIAKMAFVGIHDVPCFGFSPYPGSELFNQLYAQKKIVRDENYNTFLANLVLTRLFNSASWNPRFPGFMIPLFNLGGMIWFYSLQFLFRPWRLYTFFKRFVTNKPETMIEIAFTNLFKDFILRKRFKNHTKLAEQKA